MMQLTLIIFDLDGVITDEKPYWDSAREAVTDLLRRSDVAPQLIPRDPLPRSLIYWLKNRAINNNWDVAFFATCANLYRLSSSEPASANEKFLAGGERLAGVELLRYAGAALASACEADEHDTFEYGGTLSKLCHEAAQEIHDRRVKSGEGKHVGVLPSSDMRTALAELHAMYGRGLGVATGRLRVEAIGALETLGLLEYFDPRRIVTYDDILEAEQLMMRSGEPVTLGKPHPFALLKVIDPGKDVRSLAALKYPAGQRHDILFVGDTTSDVYSAKAAGVQSLCVVGAVLDPNAKQERIAQLRIAGCELFVESVSDLPEFLRTHQKGEPQ